MKAGTCNEASPQQCEEQYNTFRELVDGKKGCTEEALGHVSNCPMYTGKANCWATTAYQKCDKNRQGAYDAVMKAGTCNEASPQQCEEQYNTFRELVDGKKGCTEAMKYIIIDSETVGGPFASCAAAGYFDVTAKDTCEEAAIALGLSDTTASNFDNAKLPSKCQTSFGTLFWNSVAEATGSEHCGLNNRPCICRTQVACLNID